MITVRTSGTFVRRHTLDVKDALTFDVRMIWMARMRDRWRRNGYGTIFGGFIDHLTMFSYPSL